MAYYDDDEPSEDTTEQQVVISGDLPVEFDDLGSMGHVGPEVSEGE